MRSGRNVLWSSDIFPAGQRAAGASPEAILPTAPMMPEAEGAYLRYGRGIAQALAQAPDRRGRLHDVLEALKGQDSKGFDFDQARTAIDVLVRRGAVELTVDPSSGNHLVQLTRTGWILAA